MFLKPPKRSRMEIKYRNSNCFKNISNTLWNQCMTKCITSFAKDLVTATWRVQKMLLTYNKLLHEEKGTDFDQSLTSEFVKLWQHFKIWRQNYYYLEILIRRLEIWKFEILSIVCKIFFQVFSFRYMILLNFALEWTNAMK